MLRIQAYAHAKHTHAHTASQNTYAHYHHHHHQYLGHHCDRVHHLLPPALPWLPEVLEVPPRIKPFVLCCLLFVVFTLCVRSDTHTSKPRQPTDKNLRNTFHMHACYTKQNTTHLKSVLVLTHSTRRGTPLLRVSQYSLINAAIWRPLPTPAPSPRKKPARAPAQGVFFRLV